MPHILILIKFMLIFIFEIPKLHKDYCTLLFVLSNKKLFAVCTGLFGQSIKVMFCQILKWSYSAF